MIQSKGQKIFNVFNYIFLFIVCLTCLLPFIHLLAISFSSSVAVTSNIVRFWPVDFNIDAYAFAFMGGRFFEAFWVSVQRVFLGVIINLLLIVLTAYPLSLPGDRLMGRNYIMGFFVVTMILNGGIIPTFILVSNLGLLDTIWALVLPTALPIFSMIVMMNFIRGLPMELQESAMMDGAGVVTILFRILLPLLKPCIATVGLFSIVTHWNDWFAGLIYLRNPALYPLQTYLHFLLMDIEQIMQLAGRGDFARIIARMSAQSGRAAQLFLGAIPMLMIYPFLQKYFITGLVIGSVKE